MLTIFSNIAGGVYHISSESRPAQNNRLQSPVPTQCDWETILQICNLTVLLIIKEECSLTISGRQSSAFWRSPACAWHRILNPSASLKPQGMSTTSPAFWTHLHRKQCAIPASRLIRKPKLKSPSSRFTRWTVQTLKATRPTSTKPGGSDQNPAIAAY